MYYLWLIIINYRLFSKFKARSIQKSYLYFSMVIEIKNSSVEKYCINWNVIGTFT